MKIIKGIIAYHGEILKYEAEVNTPLELPKIEDLNVIILRLEPQNPEEILADLDIDLGEAINTVAQDAKERYLSPGTKEDELFDDGLERLAGIYHPEEDEEQEAPDDYQIIKGILSRWGIIYTYTAHVGHSPAYYIDILEIRRKDTGQVLDNVVLSLTEACFDDAEARFLNFPNIKEDEFYNDFLARMDAEEEEEEETNQQEKIIQLEAELDRAMGQICNLESRLERVYDELDEAGDSIDTVIYSLKKFFTSLGAEVEYEDVEDGLALVMELFQGYSDITLNAGADITKFFEAVASQRDEPSDD